MQTNKLKAIIDGNSEPQLERDYRAEVRNLQKQIDRFTQTRIDGVLYSPFEQYMIECGILKFVNGERIITDAAAYHRYQDLEDRRVSFKAWQLAQDGTTPVFDLTRPAGLVKRISAD